MASFPDRLAVEMVDEGHWRILHDFRFDSDVAHARIIVLAGFITDFASVPRIPLAYLLAGGTAQAAAVIHDYLYTVGIFTKAISDAVFNEAMIASGIPAWRRWLMYSSVRWFGGAVWARHRGDDVPNGLPPSPPIEAP